MKRRIIATILVLSILCAYALAPAAADNNGNTSQYAVPDPEVTEIYVWDREIDLQSPFYHEDFAEGTVFYIEDSYTDSSNTVWYLVSFHAGSVVGDFVDAWPADPWVRADCLLFVELCACCEHCTEDEDCACICGECEYCEPDTDPTEPEFPTEPVFVEDTEGCICEPALTYGAPGHGEDCPYAFANITVEEAYIVYVTMTQEQQTDALASMDADKKAELEAYIAAHPYVSTVSEDGVSINACSVPAGATVTAEVVDNELTATFLPRITLANQTIFALDIKVYNADGTQWQPGSGRQVMLKATMEETTVGQKMDLIHYMDDPSKIEEGLANGSVKLLDISHLFFKEVVDEEEDDETVETGETGGAGESEETGETGETEEIAQINAEEPKESELVEIIPELPEAYWNALAATAELGYDKQIAYEIITATCVDEGYITFYTDSFSTFNASNLTSGKYYIKHDLSGWGDHTGVGSNWKGFYSEDGNKSSQLHDYYITEIPNVTINSGNTVDIIFVDGDVPVSGTITVNGTLNMYLLKEKARFYTFHLSFIWSGYRYTGDTYTVRSTTMYRKSGNTGALIKVNNGGTLNLSGISGTNTFIIDGKSISASNAAIVSSGTVNLTNVTINNCVSTANGGALRSTGANNTLTDVIISNCSSSGGGAIYTPATNKRLNFTLTRVSITGCSATGNGGGISFNESVAADFNTVTISSCTAGAAGGGIIFVGTDGRQSDVKLTSVNITGCKANEGSGIMLASSTASNTCFSGKLTATSCTLTGNFGDSGLGGTVRTNGGVDAAVEFINCTISSNTSPGHGGAFYWNAGGTSTLTLDSCTITNNTAANEGGAIFCEAIMEIQGATKINGNSAQNGGAISISTYKGGATTIDGCKLIFSKNIEICNNTASIYGGGIFMEMDYSQYLSETAVFEVKLNGAKLSGNTAQRGGGAYITRDSDDAKTASYQCTVDLNYGEIKNNTATAGNGGAIYTRDIIVLIGNTGGQAMTISNNKADSGIGGAVYSTGTKGSCSITNGTLLSNSAKNGGAVGVENGVVTIKGGTMNSNTATNHGGAIYATGANGSCTVSNGTITSNKATNGNGGAICVESGTVTVSGGTISSNTATNGNGGAIYSSGSCGISNGAVTGNSAKSGGAIAVEGGNVTVSGGTINGNTATNYGGAIYSSGSCSVSNGAVTGNNATYGGAIYATGTSGSVTVSGNGSVSSNTAANGGGIYATGGAAVNVTGGIISGNKAEGTPSVTTAYNDAAPSGVGGGIYVGNGTGSKSSSVTLSGSAVGLYGNTANFAAADAYASGMYTSVTLPDVKNMNLSGFDGSATGWYEDYATADTGYANGFQGGAAGERYAKARNTYEIASASGVTKYAAITLGVTKSGYGNLTIQKTGANIDPDQVFIFEVTGGDVKMQVAVKGTGSVTIYQLKDATYTVTEVTSWSWRYTPDSVTKNATISGTNVNPVVTFTNSLTNENWLSAFYNIINAKGS